MSKRVPRPAKARQLNPAGAWEVSPAHMARAHSGEQSIGFYLGEEGYFIIEGPSGAGGHGANASGFDGVAWHPEKKELIIYDNKAYKRSSASSATAMKENLMENLEKQIKRLEDAKAAGHHIPHSDQILELLKEARKAAKTGKAWPKAVKLYMYGVSGNVLRISRKLATPKGDMKIEFKSWRDMKKARKPWYKNPAAKKALKDLDENVLKAEKKAADAIIKRGTAKAEKRLGRAVIAKGANFVKKRMPKLIAQTLLKSSAKKAAKRAASLVPLAGWGFAAYDAYHGVEDIMRGHTGRGLAGIGLSIVDVGADFVHVGDVVSGVGGTALSLGIQAGTIAGQIKIELDREEDKMNELGEEIGRLNDLPPDDRLRGYYDLDEETIQDLKKEYAAPESEPEGEPEMPELPPDIDVPPSLVPELSVPPPPPVAPGAAPKPERDHEPLLYPIDGPRGTRWADQPIA